MTAIGISGVFLIVRKVNMEIYLVGGAVRDQLLGLPVKDRDWLVVGTNSETMLGKGYLCVGKDFPVFLHPETREEYALARTERKTGVGYTGFEFQASEDVTLEEDLMRRDLTINAMAQTNEGEIVDPYGGLNDIENRKLRHVSPSFAEDPLRVLRVARLHARYANLGFEVDDETLGLMRKLVDEGELSHLTPERVWSETKRALMEDRPEVYIETLRSVGALSVLFPSIDKLFGVPQTPEHHPEIDTGIHTLMSLQQAVKLSQGLSEDDALALRYAALVHDLGKGLTPEEEWPRHLQHESNGVPLVRDVSNQYRVSKRIMHIAAIVAREHLKVHRAFELKAGTLMKMFEAADAFRKKDAWKIIVMACEADARGRTGFEDRAYPQADYLISALEHAASIDITSLRERYQGKALGEQIRNSRMQAIANFKKEFLEREKV